jgi:hypothetical protein
MKESLGGDNRSEQDLNPEEFWGNLRDLEDKSGFAFELDPEREGKALVIIDGDIHIPGEDLWVSPVYGVNVDSQIVTVANRGDRGGFAYPHVSRVWDLQAAYETAAALDTLEQAVKQFNDDLEAWPSAKY